MAQNVIDRAELQEICRRNDIVFLGLFGSFARGDFTPESDVDLLARFSAPKSLLELARIEREIHELLGRPVDLLTEAALSPYLRKRILASTRSVYEQAG